MMHHQMWLIRVFECLSALDAEVALVDISDCFQTINHRSKHRVILNNHIYINAWLSKHSFYRGASNVFNAENQIAYRHFNLTLYFIKS